MRISAPTYTQTPNDLFDHWLPFLKEVELKVLLIIMRKTFGWHKIKDRISISQLQKLSGSTETNVIKAIKGLIAKGLINKEVIGPNGRQETYYELVITEDSNNSYPSQINRGDPSQTDRGTPPNLGGGTPPNLGGTKETLKKMVKENDDGMKAKPSRLKIKFLDGREELFSKQDLFSLAVTSRSDWSVSDIEYLYLKLESYKSQISDLKKLCDKILANKSIAERAEKYAGKDYYKGKNERHIPEHEKLPITPQGKMVSWEEMIKKKEDEKLKKDLENK